MPTSRSARATSSILAASVVLLAIVVAPASARAADVAVNAGFVEVVTLPDRQHFGLYSYAGFSLAFVLPHVTLIPQVTVEAAPESQRWGFVGSLTADFGVSKYVGIDIGAVLLHDQYGSQWSAAELLVGGGVGFSVFAGHWTFSPFVNALYDLMVPSWVLVPGLNLAYTI